MVMTKAKGGCFDQGLMTRLPLGRAARKAVEKQWPGRSDQWIQRFPIGMSWWFCQKATRNQKNPEVTITYERGRETQKWQKKMVDAIISIID